MTREDKFKLYGKMLSESVLGYSMYLSKSLCNLISNFLKIPLVASDQLFQDTNLSGGLFRRFDEGKCTFVLYHSIFDLIDPIYNFFFSTSQTLSSAYELSQL